MGLSNLDPPYDQGLLHTMQVLNHKKGMYIEKNNTNKKEWKNLFSAGRH